MNSLAPDWHALQGALTGEDVLRGSLGYESVSEPAIARFLRFPQSIPTGGQATLSGGYNVG
jgi:hypothetical protein